MSENRANEAKLAGIVWRIADSTRGEIKQSERTVMMPLWAYVALLKKDAEEGASLEEVLDEARVKPNVRQYLLSAWDKRWIEPTRMLAHDIDADTLKEFILYYDFTADGEKWSGEFGTPSCVNKLALAILDVQQGEHVADLGCGYGNFLVELAEVCEDAALYGIDVNSAAACIAQIRMDLIGGNARIANDDMLSCDTDALFDKVFSNYPFGMRFTKMGRGGKYYDAYRTGETGFGRPSSADWMFNKVICDSLAPNGKAVAIMTNGAAFNGGDKQARKYYLDNGMIQAVMALPGNLFRYTAISTTLIVLGHNDGPVRFVDASDLTVPGRRWDTMGDDEIDEAVRRLSEDGDFSRLVDKGELAANEYSLFPSRYLGREIELVNPTPLGKLADDIERGAGLTAKDLDAITTDEDAGISYLRLSDITDGRIGSDLPHISTLDPKLEKQCLRTGDLVMSKNGAPFKIAVAEVPEGQTILTNGNLYILRLDQEHVSPYYVAAFLASEDGKELMSRMVVGTTIPNLPLKNLKDIEIPLPSLDEQQAIADAYNARLDEIEILKIKLDKARNGAASAYDEVMGR